MAVFRRRSNQTNVPAEIQEYYQTERRERAGVAWLLALGTLLVTVVLAVGLFFGSRWVYRKVANDKPKTAQNTPEKEQTETEQPAATNNQQTEADKKAAEEKQKQEEAKKQQEAKKQADAKAAEEQKKKDEEAKKKAEAEHQADGHNHTAATTTPQVAATQTNANMPNTGPEDTVAVLIILVVAGYSIHRILLSARATKRRTLL